MDALLRLLADARSLIRVAGLTVPQSVDTDDARFLLAIVREALMRANLGGDSLLDYGTVLDIEHVLDRIDAALTNHSED